MFVLIIVDKLLTGIKPPDEINVIAKLNESKDLKSKIFKITNIGISLDQSPKNLSFIFLILIIIGGSFFSTSSGIRLLKLYALFKS